MTLYNRPVKEKKVFPAQIVPFAAWYDAAQYLRENGYNVGSRDFPNPTAFVAGKYQLPQKWSDLNAQHRATVAGIVSSRDPKNCEVNVYFFE